MNTRIISSNPVSRAAAIALFSLIAVPAFASAQSYGYYPSNNYYGSYTPQSTSYSYPNYSSGYSSGRSNYSYQQPTYTSYSYPNTYPQYTSGSTINSYSYPSTSHNISGPIGNYNFNISTPVSVPTTVVYTSYTPSTNSYGGGYSYPQQTSGYQYQQQSGSQGGYSSGGAWGGYGSGSSNSSGTYSNNYASYPRSSATPTGTYDAFGAPLCRWSDYPSAATSCNQDPQQWVFDPYTSTWY